MRRAFLLLITTAWAFYSTAQDSTCSDGTPGIENADGDVCCPVECGVCGERGCASAGGGSAAGLGSDYCCLGFTRRFGQPCGEAPCLVVADVNACLDLNNSDNQCRVRRTGYMTLSQYGITDEDVESGLLSACLDAAGRENIVDLNLSVNELTTLPVDIFDSLTALTELSLSHNDLVTLPAGVFDQLTELIELTMDDNALTALPSGVFDSLTKMTRLWIPHNPITTLPVGIFDPLTEMEVLTISYIDLVTLEPGVFDSLTKLSNLGMENNALSTLPPGVFDSNAALTNLDIAANGLTTLPSGLFDSLTELVWLNLAQNPDLECVPPVVASDLSFFVDDTVGTECGCELPDGTNPCGDNMTCTPGAEGFNCV